MKNQLSLTSLKKKREEIRKEEMVRVRSGKSACGACTSECFDVPDFTSIADMSLLVSRMHGGDDDDGINLSCECGSIWMVFGMG